MLTDTLAVTFGARRVPGIARSGPILACLCIALFSMMFPVEAAGYVLVCNETALDVALSAGGRVKFKCSGTIVVTSPKIITRDTTLDATGQHVIIIGKDLQNVFDVQPGVTLKLKNLSVIKPEEADRLPATGYARLHTTQPPSEWLFVGLGALALALVSLIAGIFTRIGWRPNRRG